jgi:osmotically-inducible protein OsmY
MATSSAQPERYRLEIRRTAESFETHGFFESLALAEQAAEAIGAAYRITCEDGPVTTASQYQPLLTHHPQPQLDDDQLRSAIRLGLAADPRTAQLEVDVDVMDHRVFLSGHVEDLSAVRQVEQAAARVADVGEVVDLLEVESAC